MTDSVENNSPHCPDAAADSWSQPRSKSRSPRGPGIVESLLWFCGTWIVHGLGLLATVGLLGWIFTSSGVGWSSLELLEFMESQQFTLLAGEQFVFVSIALLAAWWRLRGRLGQRLGSRPLTFEHFFLLTCLIIPISTICTLIHQAGMLGWQQLLTQFPQFQVYDSLQAMELLGQMANSQPTWALLLVFAVAPALGEELIFRGVIGRGLVARWGMLPGILLTSILFAAAHLHPVHMLAVLPMGIVLHYVYYVTRSFWAPLYVHFGNNALAVFLAGGAAATPAMEGFTVSALITVSLSLLVFLALLWQARIHFVREDGSTWVAPRFQLELPVELPLRQTYNCLSWQVCVGGLVPLLGFLIAYSAHL